MIGSAGSPRPHEKVAFTLAGPGVIGAGFALPRVPTGGRRSLACSANFTGWLLAETRNIPLFGVRPFRCAVAQRCRPGGRRSLASATISLAGVLAETRNIPLFGVRPLRCAVAQRCRPGGRRSLASGAIFTGWLLAETRNIPLFGVFPSARLRRAAPTGSRRSLAGAPCRRRAVGVSWPMAARPV